LKRDFHSPRPRTGDSYPGSTSRYVPPCNLDRLPRGPWSWTPRARFLARTLWKRYKLRPTMPLLSCHLWHYRGRDSLTALLVFVALVLLAQTAAPAHLHSDGEPGIYNAQCPLAALATTQREGPVSAVSVAGWVAVVAPLLVFGSATCTPDSPFDLASSRAPPLA